jgi:hypothetical protein
MPSVSHLVLPQKGNQNRWSAIKDSEFDASLRELKLYEQNLTKQNCMANYMNKIVWTVWNWSL